MLKVFQLTLIRLFFVYFLFPSLCNNHFLVLFELWRVETKSDCGSVCFLNNMNYYILSYSCMLQNLYQCIFIHMYMFTYIHPYVRSFGVVYHAT